MRLKDAIDTLISHNAYIGICIDEHNGFSKTIWRGMVHELPESLRYKEFKPITDYVSDSIMCPLLIELNEDLTEDELNIIKNDENNDIQHTIYKEDTTKCCICKEIDGVTYYETETLCGKTFADYVGHQICLFLTSKEAQEEIDKQNNKNNGFMDGAKIKYFHSAIRIY